MIYNALLRNYIEPKTDSIQRKDEAKLSRLRPNQRNRAEP